MIYLIIYPLMDSDIFLFFSLQSICLYLLLFTCAFAPQIRLPKGPFLANF